MQTGTFFGHGPPRNVSTVAVSPGVGVDIAELLAVTHDLYGGHL